MSSAPAAGPAAARICFGLFSGTSSRTLPVYYGHDHLNFTALLFFAQQFITSSLMDVLSESSLFNRCGHFQLSHQANKEKSVFHLMAHVNV